MPVLIVLLFLAGESSAAVTEVGTPTGYKANNTTFSFSHTTVSGTDGLVCGTASSGGATTALTAGGAAMTQIASASGTWDTGGAGHIALWIKRTPSVGTITIAASTGDANEFSAGCVNFTGVDTSSDVNAANGGAAASGTSATPTSTAGGSPTANDLVVDVIGWYGEDVSSVGADQTSRVDQSSGDFRTTAAMSRQAGNISPATMSWTLTGSTTWGAASAVIKAAGGGGGGATPRTLTLMGVGQ